MLLLAVLGIAIFAPLAAAQSPLVLAIGLTEGAMKEKKLVLYSAMELPQTIEVIREFVEKYPFLDVELHPLETETLVARVQSEARLGIPGCDVLIAGGGFLQPLFQERLLASYHSPKREFVSQALNDRAGFWSAFYINHFALGYHTTLVKQEQVPKTYEDLLEPRWKGNRIAIDSTAHGLLRGLGPIWGEDKALAYLKRLAEQQPVMSQASITAVDALHLGNVSMVIARTPVIQGYRQKLGSPIDWVFLEPVVAQIDAVMLSAQSAHPRAARLFVDYVLSKEGQSVLRGVQQMPVRRDMDATAKRRTRASYQWFVERPDQHVNFHGTVKTFREVFGIQ
jgi:ABC-type Fe3+ transport system substrate-binding protein